VKELAREILGGEEAWIVGGAVRDELLGRPLIDLDVACREPERAAREFARRAGAAPFPLSERHGAWRVAFADGRTVDFTPLRNGIREDLATRDFTINAIARALEGEEVADPYGGRADLAASTIRAVAGTIFSDDPLRLLRAVRLEDELGFSIEAETEQLLRDHANLVTQPAGERTLAELRRLSPAGYRRLAQVGLLQRLGGRVDERLDRVDSPEFRLVAAFGKSLFKLPISNELRRYARALLRAERPADDSPRAVHRFRRATEPWSLDALAFVGAEELARAIEKARRTEPKEPLLRGDELGLPPGPAIGALLDEIDEERAAGTICTREEALEYARRRTGSLRRDG
jgi:Poly A polymerase head domain/Probable RNA and SrmB- binding site of polymerase A